MLYYFFEYLDQVTELSGAGVFRYISFRAAMAVILALIISLLFGGKWIKFLQKQQIKESVRDLGLAGENLKQGTPTMGGLIILTAILVPTLLCARLDNIYVGVLLLATVWMGTVGFLDDYIKVFKGKKAGLAGRFKVIGQIGLGLIVGLIMLQHDDVKVRAQVNEIEGLTIQRELNRFEVKNPDGSVRQMVDFKAPVTTIPLIKQWDGSYGTILGLFGKGLEKYAWLIYVPLVIIIITAVSNGANMTDGLDGLATGVSGIIGVTLGIFAYVSGNSIAANYLNIHHLPGVGELVIFSAAFTGACIGFLWFNSFPAKVFMGDTGSLALGGIIGSMAILIRKELLLPILCGVFLVENLSVMIQVAYFKYTKRKYGEGRRVFLMAPLHHHYQKLGMHESKIVTRFWIVSLLLAILTFTTLKTR